MTAKCSMSADMQYRCKTHPCNHFNHISPYFAESSTELRPCQVLSFFHNSEKVISRFGPAVRFTDDISSYKVYFVLDNIIGIQKNQCVHMSHFITTSCTVLSLLVPCFFPVFPLLLVFFSCSSYVFRCFFNH